MNITECTSLSIDNKEVESLNFDGRCVYSTLAYGTDYANDFAYSVLSAAELCGTKDYDGTTYRVYKSFDNPSFQPMSQGVFAISPHVVVRAQHASGNPSTAVFDSGTVNISSWTTLRAWAEQNGVWDNKYSSLDIGDVAIGLVSAGTPIGDSCVPYVVDEDYVKRQFQSQTIANIVFWQNEQYFTQAIPYVLNTFSVERRITYYSAYSRKQLLRADLSAVIEEMGPQMPMVYGDSGRPFYMMMDGQPILISHAHTSNFSTYVSGPNYIGLYDLLKAVAEAQGDTLKTPRLIQK